MPGFEKRWLAAMVVLAGWIGSAGAQPTVTMISSNSLSGQSWATTSGGVSPFWSDGLGAHAGAFYEVDAGFTVRGPNSGSPTFPGDRLTLDGGQFNLSSSSGTTTTVGDLVLQAGGVVVNGIGSSTQTLAGAVSIAEEQTGFIRTAGGASDSRNITVSAVLSGGGTLHVMNRGTVSLTNASNTFTGNFRIGGVNVQPGSGPVQSNTATIATTLRATVAGSMGANTSVEVNDFGTFNPDFDWVTTGSLTINTNGALALDDASQSLSVYEFVINGSSLAPGTYSYTQLRETYGNFIAAGGQDSASVTVVPEPAAASTLAAAAGCLLWRRRRRGIQ